MKKGENDYINDYIEPVLNDWLEKWNSQSDVDSKVETSHFDLIQAYQSMKEKIEDLTREKQNILLVDWEYECADGCCFYCGQDIYLNDKQLDENQAENNENALIAVLTELGYEVEIQNEIENE